MLAQRMGDFVAHDDCDFVVREVELRDQARIEHDPSARHAECVEFLALDHVDLPGPAGCIGAERPRLRLDAGRDGPHPRRERRIGVERAFLLRLIRELLVRLRRDLIELFSGNQQQLGAIHPDGAGIGRRLTAPEREHGAAHGESGSDQAELGHSGRSN